MKRLLRFMLASFMAIMLCGWLLGCMTKGSGKWTIKTPMGELSYDVKIVEPYVISFDKKGWDWWNDDQTHPPTGVLDQPINLGLGLEVQPPPGGD